MIAAGQLKMSDALGGVRTTWLDVVLGSDGLMPDVFHNVNRPEDLL
ncbi:MAG: hypothetical protein WEC15_03295 [Flavobacteriales bacterium]